MQIAFLSIVFIAAVQAMVPTLQNFNCKNWEEKDDRHWMDNMKVFMRNMGDGKYLPSHRAFVPWKYVHLDRDLGKCIVYTCLNVAGWAEGGAAFNPHKEFSIDFSREVEVSKSYERVTGVSDTHTTSESTELGISMKNTAGAVFASVEVQASLSKTLSTSDAKTTSNSESSRNQVRDLTSVSGTLPPRTRVVFYKPKIEVRTYAMCHRRVMDYSSVRKKWVIPRNIYTFHEIGISMSEQPSIMALFSKMEPNELIFTGKHSAKALRKSNSSMINNEPSITSSNPNWTILPMQFN